MEPLIEAFESGQLKWCGGNSRMTEERTDRSKIFQKTFAYKI